MERPTFSPSLGINMGLDMQCHSFVRDGKIEFLSDCHHELRGQTVDLPDEEPLTQKESDPRRAHASDNRQARPE